MSRPNPSKVARQKAFASILGLVIAVFLLEVGASWMGPDAAYQTAEGEYPSNPRDYFDELPSMDGNARYGIKMKTGLGIGGRTGALAADRPPARILGLGDSHAQGQGVRWEDTHYEVLGKLLQAEGVNSSIRNSAVSGYHLEEIAARYMYETEGGLRYPLVIYTLVLDDFKMEPVNDDGEEFVRTIPEHDLDPWRARSAIWNLICEYQEKKEVSEATTGDYLEDFAANFKSERFDAKAKLMTALAKQVEADGGEFVLAIMPLFYKFEDYPFTEVHDTLLEMGKKNNFRVLDLYPGMSKYKASELWVHETDHHPNEIGHRSAAESLAKYLKEEGLLVGL